MKLWLLRPREEFTENREGAEGPWVPWYDKAFGFVARAPDELTARQLAQAEGGDEIAKDWEDEGRVRESVPAWTDPRYSTCVELTAEGGLGVILRDFASA